MVESWVLKVSIHCEGCKKKLNKVLNKVKGVHTIDIDSNQNRVTVTGDVDGEFLVRTLLKYGKHSELLTEKNSSSSAAAVAAADGQAEVEEKAGEDVGEGKPVQITAPMTGGDAAVAERKKGKEVQREESGEDSVGGDDSGSLLPAEQQPVYTMSYSAVHPSISYAYYQAPPEMTSGYGYTAYTPPPATYTPEYYLPEYYSPESYYGSMEPPNGSYDMFSEENPNACNLM